MSVDIIVPFGCNGYYQYNQLIIAIKHRN